MRPEILIFQNRKYNSVSKTIIIKLLGWKMCYHLLLVNKSVLKYVTVYTVINTKYLQHFLNNIFINSWKKKSINTIKEQQLCNNIFRSFFCMNTESQTFYQIYGHTPQLFYWYFDLFNVYFKAFQFLPLELTRYYDL